jgi:hypothetical protein
VLGLDFNFYGPRASRLVEYFESKAKGIGPNGFSLLPILKKDAYEQLAKVGSLKLVDFKVAASFAEAQKDADKSLFSSLASAASFSGAKEVEIVLRPAKYSREKLNSSILSWVKKVAKQSGLHEASSRFVVQGEEKDSCAGVKIDLLNDQLIAYKRIARVNNRSRAIDSSAAFIAIRDAYSELKIDIDTVIGPEK